MKTFKTTAPAYDYRGVEQCAAEPMYANAVKSKEQLTEITGEILEAADNLSRLNEDYSILADKLFGPTPECDQPCGNAIDRSGAVGQLYWAVDVLNERIRIAREIVRRFNNLA